MIRVIIFCAIVLLVAFGASAQELPLMPPHEQPGPSRPKVFMIPMQAAAADAISLNVIGATPGAGVPDLKHSIQFPKNMTRDEAIDACVKELAEFLKHKFPDTVSLIGRAATCVVPEVMGDPS